VGGTEEKNQRQPVVGPLILFRAENLERMIQGGKEGFGGQEGGVYGP